MESVNFLIKPASGLCNMRCRYCFYEDETDNRSVKNMGIMMPETSETLIRSSFEDPACKGVSFAFQGGEPTMAGLDYFRHFTATVQKYNTRRIPVNYAIQTNGLAVNEEWADLFAANHFLVGVSIDGDKAIHDEFRIDAKGKETWNRVTKNLALMQHKGVELNILCVVTKRCAKSPARVYRSLKKLGSRYLQFIPCLDPLGAQRGSLPYSLTPDVYGSFLCGLFDEWYRDWEAGDYTSVRLFDDYVHMAMGLPSGTCATSGSCGSYFVAEGDGGLYPCDFYVLDQWKLGEVGKSTLDEVATGEKEQQFLREGRMRPAECAVCKWEKLCHGGCKRDWCRGENGPENYYCPAFKAFFEHAASRIGTIAREELMARG